MQLWTTNVQANVVRGGDHATRGMLPPPHLYLSLCLSLGVPSGRETVALHWGVRAASTSVPIRHPLSDFPQSNNCFPTLELGLRIRYDW